MGQAGSINPRPRLDTHVRPRGLGRGGEGKGGEGSPLASYAAYEASGLD